MASRTSLRLAALLLLACSAEAGTGAPGLGSLVERLGFHLRAQPPAGGHVRTAALGAAGLPVSLWRGLQAAPRAGKVPPQRRAAYFA